MKKAKKVLALVLAFALTIAGTMGATIAWLHDDDAETNVFTIGNVEIDLEETFIQESKLFPGVDVNKDVWVENTGSEEAFVRVHIAIPSMLDSGSEDQPQYAAYNNTLHFNFTGDTVADGKWNWNKNADGANYPDNGGDWNEYQQEIGGILYNVYVVTYETALAKDGTTVNVMDKVYLDKKVTNEMVAEIKEVLGENWNIKIVAEGGQVAGFEGKPYEALNTQFGVPGTYNPFA